MIAAKTEKEDNSKEELKDKTAKTSFSFIKDGLPSILDVKKAKMRLDKYLKVSRLIKPTTLAEEIAANERILVNGKLAKTI